MTLEELHKVIEDRKKEMPKNSYVASLFREGTDKIIQKVGEEAIEVVIAAKSRDRDSLVSEISDLIFHVLVLSVKFEITPSMILSELDKRRKSSSSRFTTGKKVVKIG